MSRSLVRFLQLSFMGAFGHFALKPTYVLGGGPQYGQDRIIESVSSTDTTALLKKN